MFLLGLGPGSADSGFMMLAGQHQGDLILGTARGGGPWCNDRWTPQMPTPGELARLSHVCDIPEGSLGLSEKMADLSPRQTHRGSSV